MSLNMLRQFVRWCEWLKLGDYAGICFIGQWWYCCYCLSWPGYRLAGVVCSSNHSQMIPKPGRVKKIENQSDFVWCMFDCMHYACSWWNFDLGVVSDVERHLSPSEDDHQNNSDNFSETQPILMLTGPQAGFQQQQQPPAPGQGDQSLVFLPACLPSIFQAIRFQGKCPPTRVTVCSWASD